MQNPGAIFSVYRKRGLYKRFGFLNIKCHDIVAAEKVVEEYKKHNTEQRIFVQIMDN